MRIRDRRGRRVGDCGMQFVFGASVAIAGTPSASGGSSSARPDPAVVAPGVTVSRVQTADGSVVTVAVFHGPVQFVPHTGGRDPGPRYSGLLHAGPRSPAEVVRLVLNAGLRRELVGDGACVAGNGGRGGVDFVEEQGQGAGDAGCAGPLEGDGDRGGGAGDGAGEAADDGFASQYLTGWTRDFIAVVVPAK